MTHSTAGRGGPGHSSLPQTDNGITLQRQEDELIMLIDEVLPGPEDPHRQEKLAMYSDALETGRAAAGFLETLPMQLLAGQGDEQIIEGMRVLWGDPENAAMEALKRSRKVEIEVARLVKEYGPLTQMTMWSDRGKHLGQAVILHVARQRPSEMQMLANFLTDLKRSERKFMMDGELRSFSDSWTLQEYDWLLMATSDLLGQVMHQIPGRGGQVLDAEWPNCKERSQHITMKALRAANNLPQLSGDAGLPVRLAHDWTQRNTFFATRTAGKSNERRLKDPTVLLEMLGVAVISDSEQQPWKVSTQQTRSWMDLAPPNLQAGEEACVKVTSKLKVDSLDILPRRLRDSKPGRVRGGLPKGIIQILVTSGHPLAERFKLHEAQPQAALGLPRPQVELPDPHLPLEDFAGLDHGDDRRPSGAAMLEIWQCAQQTGQALTLKLTSNKSPAAGIQAQELAIGSWVIGIGQAFEDAQEDAPLTERLSSGLLITLLSAGPVMTDDRPAHRWEGLSACVKTRVRISRLWEAGAWEPAALRWTVHQLGELCAELTRSFWLTPEQAQVCRALSEEEKRVGGQQGYGWSSDPAHHQARARLLSDPANETWTHREQIRSLASQVRIWCYALSKDTAIPALVADVMRLYAQAGRLADRLGDRLEKGGAPEAGSSPVIVSPVIVSPVIKPSEIGGLHDGQGALILRLLNWNAER